MIKELINKTIRAKRTLVYRLSWWKHQVQVKYRNREQEAYDLALGTADTLRRDLARDRPDLTVEFDLHPFPSGTMMIDFRVSDGKVERWLVVEWSSTHKQFAISDCTDEDDCCYGEGPQLVFPTLRDIQLWLPRHIRWVMGKPETVNTGTL